MGEWLTLLVAAVLGLSLLMLAARHARYRAVYRFSADDVKRARAEAARRSQAVRDGKSAEHLVSLAPIFRERFNPRDARFIGDPVDYVVFDGLQEGELRGIAFVEIKTGAARLNGNQRRVQLAVGDKPVRFDVLRL